MSKVESLSDYATSLAQQLRLNGMPEDHVESIVTEVLTSESTDPVDDFGPSSAYAESFPVTHPVQRGGGYWWWGAALGALWAVFAIVMLVTKAWSTSVPILTVGGPFVVTTLLGGVVSTVATARRRAVK